MSSTRAVHAETGRRTKELLAIAAVVAFAVWPAMHHVLCEKHAQNPWKLGGWSMYTRPPPYVDVGLYTLDDRHELNTSVLSDRTPRSARAFRAFHALRRIWGDLETPEELARAVLSESTALGGLRVYVATVDRFQDAVPDDRYRTDVYECRARERGSFCVPVVERARGPERRGALRKSLR